MTGQTGRDWVPYAAPFLVFVAFLGIKQWLPFGPEIEYPLRIAATVGALLLCSRGVLTWRPSRTLLSCGLGLVVFALWVAPDTLWPGWRHLPLFDNALTGHAESSIDASLRDRLTFLVPRLFGTAVVVPIVEELFWRGFLLRWLAARDFTRVPLGTFSPTGRRFDAMAFWTVAALFAAEHGPYWEVGLLTGILLNLWVMRRRNLADCILAHAVANAALAAWVLARGQWEYWL